MMLSNLPFSDPKLFEGRIDGHPVRLYVLENNQLKAAITNYGARLVALHVPDRNGLPEDIVLGFHDLKTYRSERDQAFGATVGRYANRIGKARFSLDGRSYHLTKNDGENHLHGGVKGFQNVVWSAHQSDQSSLSLSYRSAHLEEGYPGNLTVTVTYHLTGDHALSLTYSAETDAPTVLNLTHHAYFNLNGEGTGDILAHELSIFASNFTQPGPGLIPTGEITAVAGTPLDFRHPKPIGQDIRHEDLQVTGGYDHNYILDGQDPDEDGLILASRVFSPLSGRIMETYTSEPGMQLYTGNWLRDPGGKSGQAYKAYAGFCLETQHFPDSPNQPHFPPVVLRPGKTFFSKTIYRFRVS